MVYLCPDSRLRAEMGEPHGLIFSGGPPPRGMLRSRRIIVVGDATLSSLQKKGVTPIAALIDGRTGRKGLPPSTWDLENPRGCLSPEALSTGSMEGTVVVRGEEDLLVIPAALNSPPGTIILYGQPGIGVAVLPVDGFLKSFLSNYMASFTPYAAYPGQGVDL